MASVLIVDDDLMIADWLEEVLVEAGYEVCGIAATVADAIELGERFRPDLGVIDVRLANGGSGMDVAAALRRGGEFGVLYSTGNPESLGQAIGEGCLTKPYPGSSVITALRIVSDMVSHVPTSCKAPREFRRLNGVN